MNETARINPELLSYQTTRLQHLISGINHCCDTRKLYEVQRFGLPHAELKCIKLFNGERYLTVKEIAERLEVAKSRVTKIVEGVVGRGFMESVEDPRDARIRLLSLTPAGRKKLEEIDSFHREIHQKILLQLGPEERKVVISYLEMLRSAMEAVKETLV